MRNKVLVFILCLLFTLTITQFANAGFSVFVQNDFLNWEESLPAGKVTETGNVWKGGIKVDYTFKSIDFTIFASLFGGRGNTNYEGYVSTVLSSSLMNNLNSCTLTVDRIYVQLSFGFKKGIYKRRNFKAGIKSVLESIAISRDFSDYTITTNDTWGNPVNIDIAGPWEVWKILNLKAGVYGSYYLSKNWTLIPELGINYPVKISVDISASAYDFATGEIVNLEGTVKPDGKIGFYAGIGINWLKKLNFSLTYDVKRIDWSKYYASQDVETTYKLLSVRLTYTF
ncbi:MAG: hypothetical protein GXO57_06565 [Thermodesulfobacteria bacterium]|nr:hypothetical protein [Thermodesulfobacteriota bacterium]